VHPKFLSRLSYSSSLKGDASTELVCGTRRNRLVETIGVDSETEGSTNARAECLCIAETKDANVVDLGLDKGSRVEVSED
jgi:hypothetical protein